MTSSASEQRRDFRVRDAALRDAEAIVAFVAALNASHGEPTEHFTAAALHRDVFGASAQVKAAVAVDEADEPIGCALWHFGYETAYAARGAYLTDLFVDPLARRDGVGRALLAYVARSVDSEGGRFVWWVRQAWNVEAGAFYAKLGAIEEGVCAHAVFDAAFDALIENAR